MSTTAIGDQDVLRVGDWIAVASYLSEDELGNAEVSVTATGLVAGARLAASYRELERVASSSLNVVLIGETGTGRDTFAAALHVLSGRSGSLIPVRCALMAHSGGEPLLPIPRLVREGGPGGARQSSPRHTLYLDGIGELPADVQAKLAQALHGDSSGVDFRVVCSARRPLEYALEEGSLRGDLYARLKGAQIALPPLRARREEVLAIFKRAFAAETVDASPDLEADLAERLCTYEWRFNVGELTQIARLLAVRYGGEARLGLRHLTDVTRTHHDSKGAPRDSTGASHDPAEPRNGGRAGPQNARASGPKQLLLLAQALRASSGNVAAAARALGISRTRAYRLMRGRLDLEALRQGTGEAES